MNYGIPYQGSKSKMIKDLVKVFPKATHFYDLFGGGFSVTHGMLLHRSKSYQHFHFNEIRPGITELIKDAMEGKYSYQNFKMPFVDRETFFREKERDIFIKVVWSFGNNGENYLFGKKIEPYKKSIHNAVVFNQFDNLAKEVIGFEKFNERTTITQRRLCLRNKIEWYRKNGIPKILHQFLNDNQLKKITRIKENNSDEKLRELQQLQQLERLEQLLQLERMQRLKQLKQLEQLEQLERIKYYNTSFENVPILPDSVIYCDIPYKGTGEYDKNKNFNREKFLNWAHEIDHPVFISEYDIMDKRFFIIKSKEKRSLMSPTKEQLVKREKIFVNQYAYKKFYQGK